MGPTAESIVAAINDRYDEIDGIIYLLLTPQRSGAVKKSLTPAQALAFTRAARALEAVLELVES